MRTSTLLDNDLALAQVQAPSEICLNGARSEVCQMPAAHRDARGLCQTKSRAGANTCVERAVRQTHEALNGIEKT